MLGIYIHNIRDLRTGLTSTKGSNQFGEIGKNRFGFPVHFGSTYLTYDWVFDSGYQNIGTWVRVAAANAGR